MTPRQSLLKSTHWDERKDHEIGRYPGFPFNEGFPEYTTRKGGIPIEFDLVLVDGEHCIATVDDSRQYMAEGREWNSRGRSIGRQLVIAWKERAWVHPEQRADETLLSNTTHEEFIALPYTSKRRGTHCYDELGTRIVLEGYAPVFVSRSEIEQLLKGTTDISEEITLAYILED